MSDDGADDLTLERAVDELYGAPLPDFVTTRTRLAARAKEQGASGLAREITALRKPTVVAWLLNQVTRREPEALELVQHVGHRMRVATAAGDTEALRGLRGEREAAIIGLVAAVADVAEDDGRSLSAGAEDEVRSTVVAALASEESSDALASGALLRALSYAGFGEVELDDAVAARLDGRTPRGRAHPSTGASPGRRAPSRRSPSSYAPSRKSPGSCAPTGAGPGEGGDGDPAGDELATADGGSTTDGAEAPDGALAERIDAAERERAAAGLRLEEAQQAHDAARRRTKDLRALLASARDAEQAAHDEAAAARRALDEAEDALDEARRGD
ncbi:hypothetical protein GCM10027055_31370 [Janibacter alkaliphilus]|uniref:Uncharacterized protein n=1 Tax=Janibacter alkaliphilus TaxID=1069963 RepID=A0A852XCS9_9MICO|nr:hypothetical protein [Janibacter alkaliphilus]NYG36281.1 hypothetical protein [Janibacter alkaliphilus]